MPEPSAISELHRLADTLRLPRGCELLAFGSSVDGAEPNDLDLLIVHEAAVRGMARKLVCELEQLPELGLVHVTMLTIEEEAQFSFVDDVAAIHIAGDQLVARPTAE